MVERRGTVTTAEVVWGPDDRRRPGLPSIGVFLIVFGALLIIERTFPEYRNLGNVVVLAAGLASLVVWALGRGTVALYAGALLTALALPGTIEGLGDKRLSLIVHTRPHRAWNYQTSSAVTVSSRSSPAREALGTWS